MSRQKFMVVAAALLCSGVVWGSAPQPRTLTLLVIPERYNLVQASFDVITKRPVALVAYRGGTVTDELVLHAWTGTQWLPVSFDDYSDGSFLLSEPAQIVLVGPSDLLPESLINASKWGPMVMAIPYVETDALLNDLGRLLEFTPAEWRWFAARYNMDIADLSEADKRESWYDQMTRTPHRAPAFERPDPDTRPVPAMSASPWVLRKPGPMIHETPKDPEPEFPPVPVLRQRTVLSAPVPEISDDTDDAGYLNPRIEEVPAEDMPALEAEPTTEYDPYTK